MDPNSAPAAAETAPAAAAAETAPAAATFPSSAALGAIFRGLPPEAAQPPEVGFRYVNCLGREYDDTAARVGSLSFEVSRYGKFCITHAFDNPVTEKRAVEAAEAYLSQPLTEDYYARIRHDTFHQMPWEEAKDAFACRGACLTDARFLEVMRMDGDQLSLITGS